MTEPQTPGAQVLRPEHGTAITLVLPSSGDIGELRERVAALEAAIVSADARIEALSAALAAAVAAALPASPPPPAAAPTRAPARPMSAKVRGLRRMIAALAAR